MKSKLRGCLIVLAPCRFYPVHIVVHSVLACLTFSLLTAGIPIARLYAEEVQDKPKVSLRDLDGHFPLVVPGSLAEWQSRANEVRLQVRVATAIHPKPKLAATEAVMHGRREMDGYSIEKMYFESLPGLFVTGSLYRPLQKPRSGERHPAVLYAHGHWEDGRFYVASDEQVKELLATGAERFESAAVNMLQAACVQLARMGCVVFQYDMLGYADSQQVSHDRAHLYGLKGPNAVETDAGWPLFSAKAEGYGQSVMAIQTINTLRAIDVIGSLDDVDAAKMVITGASGGGTQSFIAAAVEPKLAGAFPAVMVSTGMQGGCTCENACGLRVGIGNVEIAATIAPRPLGLTAADDWTKNMSEDGFPELRRVYELFGKLNHVELNAFTHFPHNYNHVSRTTMYGWVNRVFEMGFSEPILERDFRLMGRNELTVWDTRHLAPTGGIEFERELLKRWASESQALFSSNSESPAHPGNSTPKYLCEGWETLLKPSLDVASRIDVESNSTFPATKVAKISAGKVVSKWKATNSRITIVLGNARLEPKAEQNAWIVESIDDVFDSPAGEQSLVEKPRPAASYTYGYNPPQLVRKLGVLLANFDSVIADLDTKAILVTDREQSFLAAGLAMLRPDKVQSVAIQAKESEIAGFFSKVDLITDPHFLPHSLRYGDLPGLVRAVEAVGVEVTFAP